MPIYFHTPTTLDPLAFQVMGLSAKLNDSPIGRFGTGLKYAIAGVLKANGTIKIETNEATYTFTIVEQTFRGKTIQQATYSIDGGSPVPLPFTLDYGQDWKPWQFFRELHSNTIDEDGFTSDQRAAPTTPAWTIITVSGYSAFAEAYNNRESYFLHDTPIASVSHLTIHTKRPEHQNFIYYRGVAVGEWEHPTIYTYNFKAGILLTEDRAIHQYSRMTLSNTLASNFAVCSNKDILPGILEANHKTFESTINYLRSLSEHNTAEPLLAQIKTYIDTGRASTINPSALEFYYKRNQSEDELYTTYILSPLDERTLAKAKKILALHFRSQTLPNIRFVTSLPDDALGMVMGGKIYISERNFAMGLGTLVGTIFEELCHFYFKYDDCSRSFQQYLIDSIARQLEANYTITNE